MFMLFGFFGAVPGAHFAFSSCRPGYGPYCGEGFLGKLDALGGLLLMGASYLIGGLVFATRFPEAWKPGRFNFIGHSHQLFHILVVMAATVHAWTIRLLIDRATDPNAVRFCT